MYKLISWRLKLTKRFLLKLVLLFCCALPAIALEDSQELIELQKIALELSNKSNNLEEKSQSLTNNLKIELPSVINYQNKFQTLSLESMEPLELLDQLEMNYNQVQMRLEMALASSKSLEEELNFMKIELTSSKQTLQNLKTALLSNKEDTSVAISEIGRLQEKIDSYNEILDLANSRIKKSALGALFLATGNTVGGAMLGSAINDTLKGNTNYNNYIASCGVILVTDALWALGHYLLKWW